MIRPIVLIKKRLPTRRKRNEIFMALRRQISWYFETFMYVHHCSIQRLHERDEKSSRKMSRWANIVLLRNLQNVIKAHSKRNSFKTKCLIFFQMEETIVEKHQFDTSEGIPQQY